MYQQKAWLSMKVSLSVYDWTTGYHMSCYLSVRYEVTLLHQWNSILIDKWCVASPSVAWYRGKDIHSHGFPAGNPAAGRKMPPIRFICWKWSCPNQACCCLPKKSKGSAVFCLTRCHCALSWASITLAGLLLLILRLGVLPMIFRWQMQSSFAHWETYWGASLMANHHRYCWPVKQSTDVDVYVLVW